MSHRARAVSFAAAAAVCGGLAASAAGGPPGGLSAQLGELRSVVVAKRPLPPGRTYVAVRSVGLLDLRPSGGEAGSDDLLTNPASESWTATLALTRAQALRLIQAESFARSVRLIGG